VVDKKKLEEAKKEIKMAKEKKEVLEVMDLPDSPGATPPMKVNKSNMFEYDDKT
jgi:hypothetical protein